MFVWQLSVGRWRNIRIREQEVLAVRPIQLVEYKRAVYNNHRRTLTEKKTLTVPTKRKIQAELPPGLYDWRSAAEKSGKFASDIWCLS